MRNHNALTQLSDDGKVVLWPHKTLCSCDSYCRHVCVLLVCGVVVVCVWGGVGGKGGGEREQREIDM